MQIKVKMINTGISQEFIRKTPLKIVTPNHGGHNNDRANSLENTLIGISPTRPIGRSTRNTIHHPRTTKNGNFFYCAAVNKLDKY